MSTRNQLSQEAARLFAQSGYHGTSVNDLARAVGIRKSSIYAHIGGKEDLLAEIALAGAEAFHAALDAVPDDVPPLDRLRNALRAHLGVVSSQLDVATVWLHEWRHLNGEAREQFMAERRRYERRVRRLFEGAAAAGALRDDVDVNQATLLFFSVANWAYTWMTKRTNIDAVADEMWALMRRGVADRG